MRALLLFLFLLTGCTSYHQGVESHWPQPDVLFVSGAGNSLSSGRRIDNYVFLHAAEKGLEAGYRYFVVAEFDDTSTMQSITSYTPIVSTTIEKEVGGAEGKPGSGHKKTITRTTGGPETHTYFYPGRDAVFIMYDARPAGYRRGQYYDVVGVYNDLGPKYIDDFEPVDPARFAGLGGLGAPDASISETEVAPVVVYQAPAAGRRPRTLTEIYASLSDEEKFLADNMSSTDRVNFLYGKR